MATECVYVINVYGKDVLVDDFKLDDIPDVLYKWELGGITDPLGQLSSFIINTINETIGGLGKDIWNWLTTIKDGIINAVNATITGIKNALSNLINKVINIVNNISSAIVGLAKQISNAFVSIHNIINSIATHISGIISSITSVINNAVSSITNFISSAIQGIQSSIQGVINSIGAIASQISSTISSFASNVVNTITSAIQGIQSAIGSIANTIGSIVGQIANTISSFLGQIPQLITGAFKQIQQWFGGIIKTISATIGQISNSISSFFGKIWQAIQNLPGWIVQGVGKLISGLQKLVEGIDKTLSKVWNQLTQVGQALAGFVNPLVEIKNWIVTKFSDFINAVTSFFTDVKSKFIDFITNLPNEISKIAKSLSSLGKIGDWLKDAWSWLASNAEQIFSKAFDAIKGVVDTIWNVLNSLANTVLNLISKAVSDIANVVRGIGEKIFDVFKGFVIDPIVKMCKDLSKTLKEALDNAIKSGTGGEYEIFAIVAPLILTTMAVTRMSVGFFMALGQNLKTDIRLGIPGTNITWTFNPGAFLMEIGSALSDTNSGFIRDVSRGIGIWMAQPISRAINVLWRNWLPLEMPSVAELLEMLRRSEPTEEYTDIYEMTKTYLQYYGFADKVIDLLIEPYEKSKLAVVVKDRFGRNVPFPVNLVYQLPTPSELCRMMVHDIFPSVEDFQKAMKARGFIEDLALLFYLLHFRYPSLEKLWEFVCRCTAGFAWVDAKPTTEGGLGYPGVSPVQLNVRATNVNQVKQALENFLSNFLVYYAKWHDYAPWAWVKGFTSDRLIMLDLMADIPQRIDARWMYKWSIIDETELFRIITARGMHPDWLEKITVAEAMNALSEERTYARTGVLNVFREGFIDEKTLNETLSNLTSVKILGKEWIVKFLPGEVKLIALRAKYDRAIDILRDYSRDLVRAYSENITAWNNVVNDLSKSIDAVKKELSINLSLDTTYFELYKSVADTLKSIYTIHRVRIWIRYMMYRILERFSRGYMTKDEMKKYIDEIVKAGKLTEEEKEFLLEISEMMYDLFIRSTKANAILKRLSRGAITEEEALRELKNLGISEDVAKALIEEKARTYVFSVDKLISMSEYVPIDLNKVIETAKNLGYPEDEIKLLPAYKLARDLNEEIGRCVTELISDYANGLITKQELEKEIDNLRTLWGEVKKYGVDWIVIDDNEKKLLIQLAEWRRKRYEARRRRGR